MCAQYYDSSTVSGNSDYSVTDLLQMMGRASRPDRDDSGKCDTLFKSKLLADMSMLVLKYLCRVLTLGLVRM